MSFSFTWFVQDRLGPLRSARIAELIGQTLAPNILTGYHVAAPVNSNGLVDRFVVFSGTTGWDTLLSSALSSEKFWSANEPVRSVVLYSRRHHDILHAHDESNAVFVASWLAAEDIHLLDWFVMTRRTIRSIPADFELPRGWP